MWSVRPFRNSFSLANRIPSFDLFPFAHRGFGYGMAIVAFPTRVLGDGHDDRDQEGLEDEEDPVDGTGVAKGDGADPQGGADKIDEEDGFPPITEQLVQAMVDVVLPHVIHPVSEGLHFPRQNPLHGDVGHVKDKDPEDENGCRE